MTERPDTLPLLDNPRSDRVRAVARLSGRSVRRRTGTFRVDGPQAVRELLAHRGDAVEQILVTADLLAADPGLAALVRAAPDRAAGRVLLRRVTPDVLRALAGDAPEAPVAPQGIVAVARDVTVDLGAALAGTPRLVALLHGANDPGNAGTVLRAADAAGADAVVLTRGSVDVLGPKTVRATSGSLFHLPVATGVDLAEAADAVRAAGLTVVATSPRATADLFADPVPERTAWLFGNEARGLDDAELAAADTTVRIPLSPRTESLNLAMAATLCLFESARRDPDPASAAPRS